MPTAPAPAVSLARPPSLDRLDRAFQVTTSLAWLAFAVLAGAIAAAFAWSCVGTAPVKVTAKGMLLSSLGIIGVDTAASGFVTSLRVEVGDRVRRGQEVATIGQFDTAAQLRAAELELGGYQNQRLRLSEFQARTEATQGRVDEDRRRALKAQAKALEQRISSLTETERGTQQMVQAGISVRAKLVQATQEVAQAQDTLAQANNSLIQISADEQARTTQNGRELLNLDLKLAETQRRIDVLKGQLDRNATIYAPADGTVVDIAVNPNQLVQVGAPLLRMVPPDAANYLQAVIYVSAADGKRVRPGMSAQIIPANARLQRDGYIEGRVLSVADLPATRESMERVLKNGSLVQQLTADGPPFEVTVALQRDPAAPSGFAWSTGRGLPNPPENGTTAEARFVVDRVPLIALAIPRAETVLEWLRSRL